MEGFFSMNSLYANMLLDMGMFAVLVLPAFFRRRSLGWVLLAMLLLFLDVLVTDEGLDLQRTLVGHGVLSWNWLGKAFSTLLSLVAVAALVLSGRFKAQDFGLTFKLQP